MSMSTIQAPPILLPEPGPGPGSRCCRTRVRDPTAPLVRDNDREPSGGDCNSYQADCPTARVSPGVLSHREGRAGSRCQATGTSPPTMSLQVTGAGSNPGGDVPHWRRLFVSLVARLTVVAFKTKCAPISESHLVAAFATCKCA
jgi:hypothetical protein